VAKPDYHDTYPVHGLGTGVGPYEFVVFTPASDKRFLVSRIWLKCIVNGLVTLTSIFFRSGSVRLTGDIPLVVAEPYNSFLAESGEEGLFVGRSLGDPFIIESSENIFLEGFVVVGEAS
jgi:hypothetical protein